ncbi:hypothetical protein M422DRAFT_243774 [Sphaerobolus stellatus SS14]|nr:hypothetical protein M422DRAFT_243774 [Sphaerobolus stellatus SS14]
MTAQLDGAIVNRTAEYSGIQQMVRQAVQNASHETEPEKSLLAKTGVKMRNPPTYDSECNLEKFENWVAGVLLFMSMYNLLGPRAEWFYQNVEQFDPEIKHWGLESVIIGLQKWFMLTLSLNKVAVNYDNIKQGSMTVQQLHQELLKLAKQMIELPDAYSYKRRFMDVLKPDIRDQVLRKGFTPEFSHIDELIEQAVMFDNAKCYTSGYNNNHGSSYLQKTAIAEHSHAQHMLLRIRVDRRVAGARIGEVILEEDEGQIEESDEGTPHPEKQQDWEDQHYHFNDEEYETRSIDEEIIHVNAVVKASGYNE